MSLARAPKLLCVDDEAGVRDSLLRLLKRDFEVIQAENGEQALALLEANRDVAVILSDYRMPGLNGVDFLKRARIMVPGAIRAILSGQMDIHQVMEAINSSEIHRFILKPWENEYLRIQMLEALQSHHTLEESERLRTLAITDPVTGLTNHRYFQERLAKEFALSQAQNHSLGLVMIDVDHFKTYNDRYGHPEGDRLLADIGNIIGDHVKDQGSASRYGGEEFVLILPKATLAQTELIADNLRQKIEKTAFSGPVGRRSFITISLGVASFPTHGQSVAELIAAADRALYQAKRQGRNQTATASGAQ